MKLTDSPEEAAFRWAWRTFLEKGLPERIRVRSRLMGGEGLGGGPEVAGRPEARAGGTGFRLEGGLFGQWREKLAERGWIAPAWPKEYGGAGLTTMQQFILNEEFAEAGAPPLGSLGGTMGGPTLIVHGTEE